MGTWQQETRAYLNKDGAEDTCRIERRREEPEEQEAGDGIVDEKQRLVEHAILAAACRLLLPFSPPLLFLWTPDTAVFHPLVFLLFRYTRSSLSCSASSWAWAGPSPKRKREIDHTLGGG